MAAQMAAAASGPAKLQAVTQLMTTFENYLENPTLSESELESSLEQLKLYGRDPTNADPIFTPHGIKTLGKLAFESKSRITARGALRVLANSMLLKPATRQLLADLDVLGTASEQLRDEGPKSWDDSFLLSRVLLVSTYAKIDIPKLIEEHDLVGAVTANLARHAEALDAPPTPQNMMQEMGLNETLRLLFNVTHFASQQAFQFTPAVNHIIPLLWKQEIPTNKPMDPPFSPLIQGLLNLDLQSEEIRSSLIPEAPDHNPTRIAERLVQLLTLSFKTKSYSESDLEQNLPPLIGVLIGLYAAGNDQVQQYLQTTLLPVEQDRNEVLGRGATLGASLLRTSSNPLTPQLGDTVSHLLFDLSDKDASKFVDNVGFGYASGFLAKNNIAVPGNIADTSNSNTSRPVNPVTGQFLDQEASPDVPEMTEDEKLREAERLFVLFERLKQTGIVDVQNPVEAAMRSGQFQETGNSSNNNNRVTEIDSD